MTEPANGSMPMPMPMPMSMSMSMSMSMRVEIDVSAVAPSGSSVVVADLFLPDGQLPRTNGADGDVGPGSTIGPDTNIGSREAGAPQPLTVVVCLPGGGMTRRYFDLPEHLPGRWSMARHLVERHGLAVLAVDHLGVGESPPPDDPYTLTPRAVAAVNDTVTREVVSRLSDGEWVDGLGPLAVDRVVGLGHSMGAMLAVYQQAGHRSFNAVALLGFGAAGLPDHLDDTERAHADVGDLDALELALPALVAARFGRALVPSTTTRSAFLNRGVSDPAAEDLLGHAAGMLLALGGLCSMIPGSTDAALAEIGVPVFLGVGEHDIVAEVERMPELLSAAPSVTLFELPQAGHNHVIADGREALWAEVGNWITALPPTPNL